MTNSRPRHLVFICSVLLCLSPVLVGAGDAGGYLRLDGGVNFGQDVGLTIEGDHGEMKLDPGFRVDLALGYDFNRWVSLELEVGYLDNSAESVTRNDQSGQLDDTWLHGVPVLANVRLQYRNRTDFVPYVGVGAGGLASMLSINGESDTQMIFAYQISAGVIYMLDERGWLDFSYKYFGTGDSSYGIGGSHVEAEDLGNHFIGASVIWRF